MKEEKQAYTGKPLSFWFLTIIAVAMILKFISHADNPNRLRYSPKYYWHYNAMQPELNEALGIIQKAGADALFNLSEHIASNEQPEKMPIKKVIDATYLYYPAKPWVDINSPIRLERSINRYLFQADNLIKENHRQSDYFELDASQYQKQKIYGFKKKIIRIFALDYPEADQKNNESAVDTALNFFTEPLKIKTACRVKEPWTLDFFPAVPEPFYINGVALASPLGNTLLVDACQRLVAISLPDQTLQKVWQANLDKSLKANFTQTFSQFYIGEELEVLAWSGAVFNYLQDIESEHNWQLLSEFALNKKQASEFIERMSYRQTQILEGQRKYRLSWFPFYFPFMLILNYIYIKIAIERKKGKFWFSWALASYVFDWLKIIIWLPMSLLGFFAAMAKARQEKILKQELARQVAIKNQQEEAKLEKIRQQIEDQKEQQRQALAAREENAHRQQVADLRSQLEEIFVFNSQAYLENPELPNEHKILLQDNLTNQALSALKAIDSEQALLQAEDEIVRLSALIAKADQYLFDLMAQKKKWLDWIALVFSQAKEKEKIKKSLIGCHLTLKDCQKRLTAPLKPRDWKKLRYDLENISQKIPLNSS